MCCQRRNEALAFVFRELYLVKKLSLRTLRQLSHKAPLSVRSCRRHDSKDGVAISAERSESSADETTKPCGSNKNDVYIYIMFSKQTVEVHVKGKPVKVHLVSTGAVSVKTKFRDATKTGYLAMLDF